MVATLQLPVDSSQPTSMKLGNNICTTTEGECKGLEPGALLEDQFVHASLENNVVPKGGGNERTLSCHRFDDPIIRPNPHKYIL